MINEARHIAVLDVGRTNKKLLVYDIHLNQVDGAFATIGDVPSGTENHEPLEATATWFLGALADMARRYRITVISISTYGGTFVCLDKKARVTLPALSGSTNPGEAFHERFDAFVGDPSDIHRKLATPRMPFLSVMARGIYYVKERYPREFARTSVILTLPQYYGFLLTGNIGIDTTYVGTHTGLWDFERMRWSRVRERLGVQDMIPATISRSWDVLGALSPEIARQTGLPGDVIVTMGIHDSNAAMLPFLLKQPDDFVLVSTGSMCVVMRPAAAARLSHEEIGEMVYYNLNVFGGVVKTALFVAGLEFDLYMGLLGTLHGRDDHPDFQPHLIADILRRCDEFILPALVPFGMYLHSPARLIEKNQIFSLEQVSKGNLPAFFRDYERAYAVLALSMALHTQTAMRRVGMSPGMTAFIEGGFSHDSLYTHLIAALFPESLIMLTDLNEASALGSAILGLAAIEGLSPQQLGDHFGMTTTRIMPYRLVGLQEYVEAFERHVAN